MSNLNQVNFEREYDGIRVVLAMMVRIPESEIVVVPGLVLCSFVR